MPRILVNENLCKGCQMCVNACPRKIIVLAKEKITSKGYHPAELIDESLCTGCCSCAMMCPDVAITVER